MGHDPVGFESSAQQIAALGRPVGAPPVRTQACVRVESLPDAEELAEALGRYVARYEVLRTTFAQPAGTTAPLQLVHPELDAPIVVHDGDDNPSVLAAALEAAWAEPVDVAVGPVMRARVVRHPGGRGTVILTAAAAVADVESLRRLASGIAGNAEVLPTGNEPLQYADYAAWQGEQRVEPDHVAHWNGLDLAPTSVGVPVSAAARPAGRRPDATPLTWAADVSPGVVGLARSAGADEADVWLALWSVLAQRFSGAERTVIGVVDDRRSVDELADAVGPFARMLPVPVDVAPGTTLRTLVVQVQAARLAADTAAEAAPPMGRILVALGFQYRAGLDACLTPPDWTDAPVVLTVSSTDGTTAAALWVDPEQVDPDHAARMGRTLAELAAGLVGDPDVDVAEINGLDQAIDGAWLAGLDGPSTGPVTPLFPEAFAAQVAAHPDRPAVSSDDRTLTYRELGGRAAGLAQLLVGQGVGQVAPVAVVMQRSIEQIVAVLAVLQAGAPHLCINPDQPAPRIAAQLAHSGATVLLSTGELAESLPEFSGVTLYVDEIDATGDPGKVADIRPEDLAYVVYTSGSTGTPKGVAVTHGGLANYVAFVTDRLIGAEVIATGPTFALVTSLSTDLGNTSVYPALATGGCLSIVPTDVALDPERFAAYQTRHPADVLKITPSHLDALLGAGAGVLPLRLLVTGGEAIRWELIDRARALGSCRVVNHYGPSETTVGSLILDLDEATPLHRSRPIVPIGRPIQNTRARVVDASLRPVAPGAVGELVIGGSGVARGYLGDEDRTAEAFLADPFGEGSEVRYYRTGDLARHLPDGTVEFLGRIDGQVKVRGYRVETGEIEEALRHHPEVQRAAVIQREDSPGDRRLVAYVVSPYSPGPDPTSLREFIRGRLPEYMVPAAFVELDELPLLANGKLDRTGLPALTDDDFDGQREYAAPSTPTEDVVAGVFADLLGIERVGAHDDFFALGGHSLLATQAIARLRNTFGVELEVHLLFTEPTVAALARAVDERGSLDGDAELAALLREIDELSDEEAEALLATESDTDTSS